MNGLLKYFKDTELKLIKDTPDLLLKSKALVHILFSDKIDKAGKPYIEHLYRVSDKMTTLDGKVAGLLHDVVEDIDGVSFDDLIDIGIPLNIIEVLKLVTKEENIQILNKYEKLDKYNKEIDNIIISGNKLALELKIADMSDNFDPSRLQELSIEQQYWFNKKYGENLKKLRKVRDSYDRY